MREILFRAKCINNGQWVYGGIRIVQGRYYIIPEDSNPFGFEVDPTTVGQFTGLYDKTGKKIFEGDILKYYKAITYVTFSLGEFHSIDCDNNRYCIVQDYNEIIGNIHDNPDLI